MPPSSVPSRLRSRMPVVLAPALTSAFVVALVLVAGVPSSSAGDEPRAIVAPRVTTREYGSPHVRTWGTGRAGLDVRRVSTNAWRTITAEKTEVGVYIEAYGIV